MKNFFKKSATRATTWSRGTSIRTTVITRTVWLLSLVSLFNDIASEIVIPIMPVFLKSIGFSFFLIGLLEGAAEAAAGISKGYFGNLSDHIGKRLPFVQIGYALSAVAKGSLAFFSSVIPVFIARVGDRLGKGVRTSARDAMLSLEAAKGTKAQVFGFHRSMDTVGAALGPFLALIYLYYNPENYKALFAITIIPGVLAITTTFFIKEKRMAATGQHKKHPGFFSFLKYWKNSDASYKTVVSGLIVFALMNSSDAFLLLAIKEKGFSDIQMIMIYIFYNLIFALLAYPIGRLSDKIGMMKTIITSLLVFVLVYFFIGFASSLVVFGILFFGYAIFAASFESTAKALISNMCRKEDTGTAIGFLSSMMSLAAIVASSWTGFVWMKFGAPTAFIISASGVLLVVLFYLFNKKIIIQKPAEQPEIP